MREWMHMKRPGERSGSQGGYSFPFDLFSVRFAKRPMKKTIQPQNQQKKKPIIPMQVKFNRSFSIQGKMQAMQAIQRASGRRGN